MDEVLIKDGIITELLIGKDRLVFPKPINLQICEEGEQVKLIQSQINLALRSNTMTSEQEISQMKILDWHIYFTQQVECRLLTEGRIYKLKFTFLEVIKEIQTGLRYQLSFYIKAL